MWRACICTHFTFENAHSLLEPDWGIQGTSIYTPTKCGRFSDYQHYLAYYAFEPEQKNGTTTVHQRCYQVCYVSHNEIK